MNLANSDNIQKPNQCYTHTTPTAFSVLLISSVIHRHILLSFMNRLEAGVNEVVSTMQKEIISSAETNLCMLREFNYD